MMSDVHQIFFGSLRILQKRTAGLAIAWALMSVSASAAFAKSEAHAQDDAVKWSVQPSRLVDDFARALESWAVGQLPSAQKTTAGQDKIQEMWMEAFAKANIEPDFVARRLEKAKIRAEKKAGGLATPDVWADWRMIRVAHIPKSSSVAETFSDPVALHAFRLDVIEDWDDVANDNVYGYFITTHDDVLWGRVTSTYKGLDEGDSVFFTTDDRGIFGPQGEKMKLGRHTLIDFGLIESDGEDIEQLKRLSDVIVDLALAALATQDPAAAAQAATASAEVKNLLHMIVELDDDDRLVADTLRFEPGAIAGMLGANSWAEIHRDYERETTFSHFHWRIGFRFLR